jgi:hypothetical protein
VIDVREAKERLNKQLDASLAVESVGSLIKCADLALLLASHEALEEALAKADEPQWFYDDRANDEAQSFLSAEEAVDYAVFSALKPPPEGTSILEINTSRPCPSVWAVVKVFTDEEREARDDDEEYIVTLCATYAEAEALLKEADQ